ncbi:MAG: ABC transporter permease [Bacteroidales bacterium]|nr:ABC transporter permease [Bacteroidales bacterium]
MADLLLLDTGVEVRMYFVSSENGQLRGRKFRISGIYETGMEEFDRLYVIGDLRQAQKLNLWDSSQVSGFELYIDRMEDLQLIGDRVFHSIGYDLDARTVATLYPQIFEWLKLQDMNVLIILILMILVSSITMVSALLIIILERTTMIGVLKALGARDQSIRRIFLIHAGTIALKGMLIGNALGLGLAVLQNLTGWVTLSQESYYIAHVPILLQPWPILLLNLGTLVACLLAMAIPSYLIFRIQPVKVIAMR